MPAKTSERVEKSVRLPRDLAEWYVATAEARDVSVNYLLTTAARQYRERQEARP
jgi:predicted transcriptional regulator